MLIAQLAMLVGGSLSLMGDAILAEFGSVVDAVRSALAIQQAMEVWNAELPEDQRILLSDWR